MQRNHEKISAGGGIMLMLVLGNTIIIEQGFISDPVWYKLAYISLPLMLGSLILYLKKQAR